MKLSMFSTIDTRRLFLILRFCGAAIGILVIWMFIAALFALAEPTATVTVFGPQPTLLQAVRTSDVELLDAGRGYVIVHGRTAGFVRALYSAGSWVVLPGGIGACGAADLPEGTPLHTGRA
jgi:hypothetical protein